MSHINEIFKSDSEGPEGDDLQVEIFHKINGFQRKTYMNGETVRDERGDSIFVSDPFKVETFVFICASAFQSVFGRFNNNEDFLKDCASSMNPQTLRRYYRKWFFE